MLSWFLSSKSLEDNTEFIEEERRALLEASKDADDNLRVASMELSRCKVALEESEDARKQWQSAVEDLRWVYCHVQASNFILGTLKFEIKANAPPRH